VGFYVSCNYIVNLSNLDDNRSNFVKYLDDGTFHDDSKYAIHDDSTFFIELIM
jgi:hypothetical protein